MKLTKMIDIGLLNIRILLFLKLSKKWLSYGQKTYAHLWARAKFSLLLLITLAKIIVVQWKFTQLFFSIFPTTCRSFRLLAYMLLVAVGKNFWIWHLKKNFQFFSIFLIFNIFNIFNNMQHFQHFSTFSTFSTIFNIFNIFQHFQHFTKISTF